MSETIYLHTAMGAILGAMGITVDVYEEQEGELIVSIRGLPSEVNKERIIQMLNSADIRPLTDLLTVRFI
jgi:hypothetical protein